MKSIARVPTDRPARYLKQLAEHLGHRIAAEYTAERGTLTFEFGVCSLTAEDGALVLHARGGDEAALARVEDVTGRHLERFGQKDELAVHWTRDLSGSN